MSPDVLDTPGAGRLVIRGGALRTAGFAASTLLSLVSAAVVIRYLGEDEFGRYVTAFSLVTLVGAVTDAGMTTLAIRSYSTEEGEERAARMRALHGLRLALTSVGTAVACVFALAAGYGDDLVLGTALASLGLLLTVTQTTLTVPLQSALLIGRVSLLDLVRQLATTIALVGLALAGAGVVEMLAVPVPVGILVLAATALLVRGRMPLAPRVDLVEWARLLRVTASFAVATAVGSLYVYTTIVVMSLVATTQETGNFGAAFRIFIVLGAVPGLLVTTAFPVLARAARDDRARLAYALQRLFEVSVAGGLLFALATVFAAPIAVDVVAGAEGFDSATEALRIKAFALIGSFLLATWGFALISLHRHRALLVANGAGLATSIVLTLILGSSYGAPGAAAATVVGESVLALGYLLAIRREPGLRPQLGRAVRALAAAVPALALGLVLWLSPLVESVLVVAVYAALVLALGALPPELTERLRAGRRRTPPPPAPS